MDLITLLLLASRQMTDAVHEQLAHEGFAGLRPAHGYAFQLISSRGAVTGVELAAHLGISRQAVSQMVDELERAGYVVRRPDPVDARLRRIAMAPRGREVIALSARIWAEQEQRWVRLIGADAMTSLVASLRAFVETGDGANSLGRLRPVW